MYGERYYIRTYLIYFTIINLLLDGIFYLDDYFYKLNESDQRAFLFSVLDKIGYLMSVYLTLEDKIILKEANKIIDKIFDNVLDIFDHDLKKQSNNYSFTEKDLFFYNARCLIFKVSLI